MFDRPYQLAVVAVAVLANFAGCVTLREYQSAAMTKMRAHAAYRSTTCPPSCAALARHYERGWMEGYIDVSKGGEGCAPPLPPEQYWSFKYQCAEGHAAIQTWYRGFQDGAHAAFADGAQQYNYIPSPSMAGPAPYHGPITYPASPVEMVPMPEDRTSALPAKASPMTSQSARPAEPRVAPGAQASLGSDRPTRLPGTSPPVVSTPSEEKANPLRPRAPSLFVTAQSSP